MKVTTKRLTVALLACSALAASSAAAAHDEGVLNLASESVQAGTAVALAGEQFAAGTYRLALKGALREYELGSIEIGADGTFSHSLAVPRDVEAGAYRLVIVASDGDEAAAVDLEVLAAAPAAMDHSAEAAAMSPQPSAEELAIERDWSGAEWFVVGVLFGGALVGGATLLRRPRAA